MTRLVVDGSGRTKARSLAGARDRLPPRLPPDGHSLVLPSSLHAPRSRLTLHLVSRSLCRTPPASNARLASASSPFPDHSLASPPTRSNVAAFAYPSYASYKSIVSSDFAQTERWLVYWCVIGCWTGAEAFAWWFLAWVPFYSEVKLAVVLWMVAPQTEVRRSPFLLARPSDSSECALLHPLATRAERLLLA